MKWKKINEIRVPVNKNEIIAHEEITICIQERTMQRSFEDGILASKIWNTHFEWTPVQPLVVVVSTRARPWSLNMSSRKCCRHIVRIQSYIFAQLVSLQENN